MVRDGAARLLTMRGETELPFRPLVVNTFRLAERAFQRIGRDGLDAGGDADGVLDEDRDLFGMRGQAAAVPAFGAGFGEHGHLVHPPLPRQFDRSEERRVGKECSSRCALYHVNIIYNMTLTDTSL